jgi:hypothetical protein
MHKGVGMAEKERYKGKPLLKLLELYVLDSIDELPESDRKTLEKMAPKLGELYGGCGTWKEAIAAAVRMPAHMPSAIRDMWQKNTQVARERGETLTPQQFAEMFVDTNLAA